MSLARAHASGSAEVRESLDLDAVLKRAQTLRELKQLDEAELLLRQAAERFPDHDAIELALASLANVRCDWPTALRRWAAIRERLPDSPVSYVGSLNALLGAGRVAEAEAILPAAEAALDAANRRGAQEKACRSLGLAIAKARCDWASLRTHAEGIIARETSPAAHVFLALAQACWHLKQAEAAEEAACNALQRDPALTEALIIGAWAATERGDGERALECYRRLAELNPQTPRWSIKRVQLLNWLGHVEDAKRELDVVRTRWPEDPSLRAFLKNFGPGSALNREHGVATAREGTDRAPNTSAGDDIFEALADAAPPERQWRRSLVVPDPQLEVQVAQVRDAISAVLVFTGAADGVSMPLPIFDRYLAALDVTVIYLKDFRRLVYLGGIRALGQNMADTIVALRKLIDGLGVEHLATIGNCDGASAAIRYGIELGATRIIAASPSTHFHRESLSVLDQGRHFKQKRLAENVPPEMIDLKPFLETHRHRAQIQVHYREEDERDCSHALRISGAPGVTLRPERGAPEQAAMHRFALSVPSFHQTLGAALGLLPRPVRG
jgi:tetratricopeptide (TPR) repeat protein